MEVPMVKPKTYNYQVNPFPANAPLMEKPGGWFLLAKYVKNTCGRVTFSSSLFNRHFQSSFSIVIFNRR